MRPPSQGDSAIALDVERLSAILRRVMADPKRKDGEKREIAKHLKLAMTLLLKRGNEVARTGS